MADGLFLVGTDRGVGKTMIGVAVVAILREMGVDATMMTPISTGGSVEDATALLRLIGVEEPRHLVHPIVYETLAAPYVAAIVEERPIELDRVWHAWQELRAQGKFVVVEGAGVMVPITRDFLMIDLMKQFQLPTLVVARSGRGTLNHCLLTHRAMMERGMPPDGFLLNGFGQYGDGFAESVNPDVLRELAAPTPVFGSIEWRPEYQEDLHAFIRAVKTQTDVPDELKRILAL